MQHLTTVLKGAEHVEVTQRKFQAVQETVKHFAAQRLKHVLDSVGHMGVGENTDTYYKHAVVLLLDDSMEDSEGSTVALCIDGVVSALEH